MRVPVRAQERVARAVADLRAGTGASAEDVATACLVTPPFAGCLMILVDTGLNAPGPVGSGIALAALAVGALWNAGRRARDE